MSYVYNIHKRLRDSMDCLLTNPDRNAALWNIYISYLVHISEDEFLDSADRTLFKNIKDELSRRNQKIIETYGEHSYIIRKFAGMKKQASGKVSRDIFKLYESINEKYNEITKR